MDIVEVNLIFQNLLIVYYNNTKEILYEINSLNFVPPFRKGANFPNLTPEKREDPFYFQREFKVRKKSFFFTLNRGGWNFFFFYKKKGRMGR